MGNIIDEACCRCVVNLKNGENVDFYDHSRKYRKDKNSIELQYDISIDYCDAL